MKKWFDEEYEFTVEVTGFLRGDHTERYCRNGEEVGDTYTCTYGCPVNRDGYGICSKTMRPCAAAAICKTWAATGSIPRPSSARTGASSSASPPGP